MYIRMLWQDIYARMEKCITSKVYPLENSIMSKCSKYNHINIYYILSIKYENVAVVSVFN